MKYYVKLMDGSYKEIKKEDIQKHLDYGSVVVSKQELKDKS
jgi:hypothetical protein